MALRGYSIHARLVDENGPKLTPDDEMDDKVAHSLDPFLSRLSRSNVKPPNFVPAFRTYDEHGLPIRARGGMRAGASEESAKPREDLAGWYKNLTRTNEPAILQSARPEVTQALTKEPLAPISAPPTPQTTHNITRKRKRGWFDSSVASIPLASASHPPTPIPTMADIVTRAPSPSQTGELSTASRNFSVIPPSNKGFRILSKSLGWREGEALGRSAKRRHTEWPKALQSDVAPVSSSRLAKEIQDAEQEGEGSTEDEEDEEENSSGEEEHNPVQIQGASQNSGGSQSVPYSGHDPTRSPPNPASSIDAAPRITPIAVALKHDRLGIGASKKRMILTSSTLARFASDSERRNLSEGAVRHNETKSRHRQRRERFGRGRNSYARMERQEAKDRERMLEYMSR